MTVVVSDTSPLNYLILVGAEAVLPDLFGSIIIPQEVVDELRRAKTPEQVRLWAHDLPAWVQIEPGNPAQFPYLDNGEAAALSIAFTKGGRLLVDEVEARTLARSLGVPVIRTVGILAEAHLRSLLDFDKAIDALTATNFRIHGKVIQAARNRILTRQPEYNHQHNQDE